MSDTHISVSSEDSTRIPGVGPNLVTPSLVTAIEDVPGYRPKGLAGSAFRGVPVVFDRTTLVDAAVAGISRFGPPDVIGGDDRLALSDTVSVPWRRTCALRIRTRTGRSLAGTGWFIGPHTVMTAGHCVFIHDEGGWAESIEVIPALNGAERPFGSVFSSRFRAVAQWTDHENLDADYAAIILDTPLGNQTGWFAFSALDKQKLRSAEANLSGYPSDRDGATRQYFHARRIMSASSTRIFYDIDSSRGQSGACVWVLHEGMRVAVGIHTRGDVTVNFGMRINEEVFNNMALWKQES